MDLIRQAADPKCSDHLVKSIDTIDKILEYGKPWVKKQLKGLFGLAGLEADDDFVSVLEVRAGTIRMSECSSLALSLSRHPLAPGNPNAGIRSSGATLSTSFARVSVVHSVFNPIFRNLSMGIPRGWSRLQRIWLLMHPLSGTEGGLRRLVICNVNFLVEFSYA